MGPADGLNREPGEAVATPPLILANETLVNVKKITGTYFNLTNASMNNAHFVAGKATSLIHFEDCVVRGSTIHYDSVGPPVRVGLGSSNGAVEEKGPGLGRRRSPAKKLEQKLEKQEKP